MHILLAALGLRVDDQHTLFEEDIIAASYGEDYEYWRDVTEQEEASARRRAGQQQKDSDQ